MWTLRCLRKQSGYSRIIDSLLTLISRHAQEWNGPLGTQVLLWSTTRLSVRNPYEHNIDALRLLQTAANGGDPLSVEAEPVHSARVAGMLDLDATIHDD